MSTFPIKNMSLDEKLRAMEELWESLSQDEAHLESPAWHEDALRQTSTAHGSGQEKPVDWGDAKRELRKRAE